MSGVTQPALEGCTGIANFRPVERASYAGLMLTKFLPSTPLRPFVQCFWRATGRAGEDAGGIELLHPDGATGLLFNFGGTLERNGERMRGDCWIDSPKRRTARLKVGQELDLLGVRFMPGMGFPFVGEALSVLAGGDMLPGDALRRLELETLHDRLGQEANLSARLTILEEYLLDRLRHGERAPSALPVALEWLRQCHGQGSITALVDELPFGQRRLERLFQRHMGLSPKHYARLLRVAHSRELIKQSGAASSLTDTAFAAGYFDQAHFIHDFKAVTGFTPGGYLDYARRRYGASS